ncbi:MAG TPA: DUF309 domain-containing protein [Candidatus Poseidoniaceae archaeon]|nr:DUF309 domain-containing protein [Candidatus Poseidoniaceae archaeon]
MGDVPAPLHGEERVHFDEGRQEFDAGRWWEAHEAWEEAWVSMKSRQAASRDILLLQGLIQCAALLYNHRRGTTRGVVNQWAKLQPKLAGYQEAWGVDVARLLALIEPYALDADACTMPQEGLRLPLVGGPLDE